MKGATIGQYRVTGLIGQGGMGAVYAGEHALLGRPAAIKILLPDLSRKQDIVMRFFNEARAATAIRHPGIIEIYDFGWTPDGAAFIVMEHLQGETLGRRLSRARFRWHAALAVARQIAGALGAAHVKGIVHRDLKPDNIFMVPDPEVPGGERIKLLDFGIAKLAGDSSAGVNVTKTGAVMGTPTYMSPEQCRGVSVDHRADLYALGCIVFELCSGRPPFQGEGTGDVLAAHIHVPVPTLASLGVEVPYAVETLLQHLLAKSPSQRVPNAEAVIRTIDAITAERFHSTEVSSSGAPLMMVSAPVTTLSGAASTSPRIPKQAVSRRGRWIAIGAAGAVTLAAVIVIVATRGPGAAAPKVVSYASVSQPAGATALGPASTQPATVPAPAPARVEPDTPKPRVEPEALQPHVEPAPAHVEPATPPSPPVAAAPPQPPATPPAAPPATPQRLPAEPAKPQAEPAKSQPAVTPQRPRVATATPHPAATAATVEATIDSVPAGAQVLLGGTVLGKTPFHGTLPRRDADVTLVIRLAGYAEKSVVVHPDQPVSQHLKLAKSATSHPPKNRDQSVNPFGD